MKFGVIGTNWITEKLIDAGKSIPDFELVAVYSRTEEKAIEFSQKHKIKYTFTSLEEMANSPLIDAVYIATPNSLHAKQSILFLENGKAVLSEKPVASNYEEALKIVDTAKENNTLFMEAMKPTHIPSYKTIKETITKIGEVRKVFFNYCQYSSKYDSYKKGIIENAFNPDFSSGALMDIGIYPLFVAISLFGVPRDIIASGELLSSGVDGQGVAVLKYDGFDAIINFSKISDSKLESEIAGENGSIIIEHISDIERVSLINRNTKNNRIDLTDRRVENGMFYELEHFIKLYNDGLKESPVNTFELSLSVIKVADEIRKQIGVKFLND